MNENFTALIIFLSAYLLNIFYITVFYHRGLAHESVTLRPWAKSWLRWTGSWVTGLDPKSWACMHRMHHRHSDTELDPHSPTNSSVIGVMLAQLRSYERVLIGVQLGREPYSSVVKDLDFPVNWLNRNRLWLLPYLVHAIIAFGIGFIFQSWLLGAAYWFGMMSHPVQGWMVNALAHKYGYRNFDNGDQSTNNTLVAWLVFGEGYQNNHHRFPESAKFSVKRFEFDGGYVLCRIARRLKILDIPARQNGPRLAK